MFQSYFLPFMPRIRLRINFDKDRGGQNVKKKTSPGGQPVKILFLFELSQEFTGGSDRFRTC